jgi:DNA-directed RNA polymerase subunit RPC12/RpoP
MADLRCTRCGSKGIADLGDTYRCAGCGREKPKPGIASATTIPAVRCDQCDGVTWAGHNCRTPPTTNPDALNPEGVAETVRAVLETHLGHPAIDDDG